VTSQRTVSGVVECAWVQEVRQKGIHISKPLILGLNVLEAEVAIVKLKRLTSQIIHKAPEEVLKLECANVF
jgi:hypothetical protein